MAKLNRDSLRKSVLDMSAYTPGEQPQEGSIIKLNTNENPYPPSPRVVDAIKNALTSDRLRKYPDPLGTKFKAAAGNALGIDPDSILIGNGSDDILTILTRAFVPESGLMASATPSYLLYKTLAAIQNARIELVPFTATWQLPPVWPFPEANLTFLANPNSPSGTLVEAAEIDRLAQSLKGPLVIDEAYGDFARHNSMGRFQNGAQPEGLVITRTMSKSYALAGIRFGFAVAHPSLVRELIKVKDSYNCDVLSLEAATAAISDQAYLKECIAKIIATRTRLHLELSKLGFKVTPSEANFLWCTHEKHSPDFLYLELKKANILVRLMKYPGHEGIRITIGSDPEIDLLLQTLRKIV